jgi:hypothetical protein
MAVRDPESDGEPLRRAAHRLEALRDRTPGGEWEVAGLLATRPEVVTRFDDGTSEHIADARARTASWIIAFAPAAAEPLLDWLRTTADGLDSGEVSGESAAAAARFAAMVLERTDP